MVATYVSQFLSFGIGIITKGLLGPDDLGLWSQLLAALSFLGLLEFGVIQAANKEISYALGKNNFLLAEQYKRVQFTFVAMTSFIGATGLYLYVLFFETAFSTFSFGLISLAVILPLSQLHLGQVTVYWANGRFGPTSLLVIAETAVAGTLGLLLVWQFGVIGQIVSFFVILIIKICSLEWQAQRITSLKIGFGWNYVALKHLLKSGTPLFLISITNVFKLSGTVFLISYYFDAQSVGYYSLALSVQNFIYWTPNAFSVVMLPRFQNRYANSNDQASALRSYLFYPIFGLAFFLLPILLSATYFLVPPLLENILPAYGPTNHILVIILIGTFFLSLEHMPTQFLITINKLWERVSISVLGLVLTAVCLAPAVIFDGNILHFVACLSIANLLNLLVILIYAILHTEGSHSDRWITLAILGAFLYLVTVTLVVDHWIASSHVSLLFDMQVAFCKWLFALFLMLPLFLIAERKLGLLTSIGGLFRQLRSSTQEL